MTLEESQEEAARILAAAGWKADPGWGGFNYGPCVGGLAPNGSVYVKNWAAIQPGHPKYGPDTPDEPHEAAAWLVANAGPKTYRLRRKSGANALASDVTFEPPPIELAGADEQVEIPTDEAHSEVSEEESAGNGDLAGDREDFALHPEQPAAEIGSALVAGGSEFEAREDEAIDADFSEPEQLPDIGLGEELAQEHPEEYGAGDGPIAYAASNLDSLVREKMGRLGQIARAKKAALHEGWTLEEFRFLQGLVVRMDRGEAPDDQASRDRFVAISEKSRAMSRLEAYRDEREAVLEEIGRLRDYQRAEAFDAEAGWP